MMEWADVYEYLLAQEVKTCFPKSDGFSNLNFGLPYSFPLQGINYLNQFLEEINDWAQKTKWVVDSSPIDIWLYPIGSRV